MQESHTARAHSCFRLDTRFPISIDDGITTESTADLMERWHGHSYRVIRSPDDLLAHIRRIRLCHEPGLHDRLIGALLDLEHVLGKGGGDLLARLNSEASQILKTNHRQDDPQSVKGRVLPTMKELLKARQQTPSQDHP